jgi:hypothetical protein
MIPPVRGSVCALCNIAEGRELLSGKHFPTWHPEDWIATTHLNQGAYTDTVRADIGHQFALPRVRLDSSNDPGKGSSVSQETRMEKNRFWLGLVGLTAAAACVLALALALVSATTALAFASRQDPSGLDGGQDASGPQRIFSGVVTDTTCGARHRATDKNAAQCTKERVENGASYALVNGDRVYRLQGNTTEMGKHAGQRAQISGQIEGDVVTVSSIAPAQ